MDNCAGFTLTQLTDCLKQFGPDLSSREVAALCHVSVKQVECVMNHASMAWWEVERVADERGWRLRMRNVISKRVNKPSEPAREYANAMGTMRPGDYQ